MEEDKEPVSRETNREIQEQQEQGQQAPQEINREIQEQEQEEQAQFPPNEVTNDPAAVEYRIHELIGTSSDGAIPVHRATYFPKNFSAFDDMSAHDLFVTLKLVKADQESQNYINLLQRVGRNGLLLHQHPNILAIDNTFTDRGFYCMVFSHMGHGSLRSIMRSKFPNGIPHVHVVVALREALQGLSFLHNHGQIHKEISAGQIFFSSIPQIKLSFSGTVYDHGTDQDDPNFLPVKSICKWASAPEVYDSQNDELYSTKVDIWMIGITALELAYGEAKIQNRGQFMSILDKMKDGRKVLPLRDDEQSPSPWKQWLLLQSLIHPFKEKLKKRFDEFVYKCLAIDPANRPTAAELLDSKLFSKRKKKDVIAFRDILKS